MSPIKNVFTACEGSEKRYSSERSWLDEKETKLEVWGRETPVEIAILNVLNSFQMKDTLFLASGDRSASYLKEKQKH